MTKSSLRFSDDYEEWFRRLGYLAVNSGFAEEELLAMTNERVEFWMGCISMHFSWVREQAGS